MNSREILLNNLDKIHTTEMGVSRIKRNLKLEEISDAVEYCVNIIKDFECKIERCGKNYYCYKDNIVITVNAYSYTIITAYLKK